MAGENLERDVAGEYNTFRVYVYLLRRKSAGTREVQRDPYAGPARPLNESIPT